MRVLRVLPLAVAAACSSTNTPVSSAPATQTVQISGGAGYSTKTKASAINDVHYDTIKTSIDRVWKTLPAVYAGLEIPIATFDSEKNLFGNAGMKVYRRLGQVPLTKLLDCGRTQIGPSADSYDIIMSVLTSLTRVDSARTIVATNVEATGRPMQYAGGETRCRTTGEVERQIALSLRARLEPR
jgi:hypothetical protein